MAAAHELIDRNGTIAVEHYVERALRARSAQGLPAAIEDDETLDKLALLMSATDVRPAANAVDATYSAGDRQSYVHASGFVHCARPAPLVDTRGRHPRDEGRPRPGANQFGAGPFSTQQVAGYGEDATSAPGGTRRGGVA